MQPPVEWDLWRCNMHSAWAQRRALVGRKESSGRTTIWRVEISLNLVIIFTCLADKSIFIHICRINVYIHHICRGAVTEIFHVMPRSTQLLAARRSASICAIWGWSISLHRAMVPRSSLMWFVASLLVDPQFMAYSKLPTWGEEFEKEMKGFLKAGFCSPKTQSTSKLKCLKQSLGQMFGVVPLSPPTRAAMESMWCSTACNLGGRDVCLIFHNKVVACSLSPIMEVENYPKSYWQGPIFHFYVCGRSRLKPCFFFFGWFWKYLEFLSWNAWTLHRLDNVL